MFVFFAVFSIRSNREMREMGLHRIPPSSVALLYGSGVLAILGTVLAALLVYLELRMPMAIENHWKVLFFAPVVFLNLDAMWNTLKCLGPAGIRRKAIGKMRMFKGAVDLHEMHYQHIGAIEPLNYDSGILLLACLHAKLEDVDELLKAGFDPDEQDSRGWNALMTASAEGRPELVELLLRYGADPNLVNYLGTSALMFASRYGFLQIVEQLLDAGAATALEVGFRDHPALSVAAANGHEDVVVLLVARGADLFHTDSNGKTALDYAMINRHAEVARILRAEILAQGGGPSTNIDSVGDSPWLGQDPLE